MEGPVVKIQSIKLAGLGCVLAGAITLMRPACAAAHLVTTGMGPVYDGIGHFLLTPEDLVAVLALALYAGLRGAGSGRLVLFMLPLAWFLGGVAGVMLPGLPAFQLPVVSFLLIGLLVAADLRVPAGAVLLLAVILGAGHGYLNGLALRDGPGISGLLGILVMLFIVVALVSAFVVSLQKPWMRIMVRVSGSWIFASGLLMLGWLIRGN